MSVSIESDVGFDRIRPRFRESDVGFDRIRPIRPRFRESDVGFDGPKRNRPIKILKVVNCWLMKFIYHTAPNHPAKYDGLGFRSLKVRICLVNRVSLIFKPASIRQAVSVESMACQCVGNSLPSSPNSYQDAFDAVSTLSHSRHGKSRNQRSYTACPNA